MQVKFPSRKVRTRDRLCREFEFLHVQPEPILND